MQFLNDTGSHIEKMVGGTGRWNIENVWYNVERGHLVATNGHGLAVVHVLPDPQDVTGYLTPESLIAYRKARTTGYTGHHSRLIAFEKEIVVTDAFGKEIHFRQSREPRQRVPELRRGLPGQGEAEASLHLGHRPAEEALRFAWLPGYTERQEQPHGSRVSLAG